MSRDIYVAEIPEALREELAEDIRQGRFPQCLVEVTETTCRISVRPSLDATWSQPLLGMKP